MSDSSLKVYLAAEELAVAARRQIIFGLVLRWKPLDNVPH